MPASTIAPGETFTCADCHVTAPAWDRLADGTAACSRYTVRTTDNAKLCTDCAETADRDRIANGAQTQFGYLACGQRIERSHRFDGVHGRQLGTVCAVGVVHHWTRRSYSGERHYLRVRMFDGSYWHGTGAPGMWCNLRRCK